MCLFSWSCGTRLKTWSLIGVCICAVSSFSAELINVDALGVRIPRGFRISVFSDSDLANDIYCMALDAQGNVAVSSQGYIRLLQDRNNDGRADNVIPIGTTRTGGMGMCFDGGDLWFCGDGQLSVFRDTNGDGIPDGPAQNIMPVHFAEHGGHAMRKGPDGSWYFLVGNESRLTNFQPTTANSPVQAIEAGAMLRLSADGSDKEIISHGFRNPYDFDFNWLGDMFTYDSDVESDYFLPWYLATRVYHVGHGVHHGWRLEGWRRSWPRPPYYADTGEPVAFMGRGSPTGVTMYRHYQFPQYYRNGLFVADWTFGRVWFAPLQANGASYTSRPEVFLEPIGNQGFAPTDLAVTPEGSLLVSIGGRRTRGAVYRIDWMGNGPPIHFRTNWLVGLSTLVEAALIAPQPLEPWSRAYWVPLATRLGAEAFHLIAMDANLLPAAQVRAIEILTEVFGGVPADVALVAAQGPSAFVRARVAWSVGRAPPANVAALLLGLGRDIDPLVRRCALEAAADQVNSLDPATLQQILGVNLAHGDKRVRLAAARLARALPEPAWAALWAQQARGGGNLQARLTTTMAALLRNPSPAVQEEPIKVALNVLGQTRVPEIRLQAIRLIILGLRDYNLYEPSVEVYTAYEPAASTKGHEPLVTSILKTVRPIVPSGDSTVDFEAGRLLGMLGDPDPLAIAKILPLMGGRNTPGTDFHYLTILSRLGAPLPTNAVTRIADVMLGLNRKLEGQESRPKQNWTLRLVEVLAAFVRKDERVAGAVVTHADFPAPPHVPLADALGSSTRKTEAAQRFFQAVRANPKFPWTGPLIDLLGMAPVEQVRPLFRQQWANVTLRDDLLLKLAEKPENADREKYVSGLGSTRPEVARAALRALKQLPAEKNAQELLACMRLLSRLQGDPKEAAFRSELLPYISSQSGQPFNIPEGAVGPMAYAPVFQWFNRSYPHLAPYLHGDEQADTRKWSGVLKNVRWELGKGMRGENIFRNRGCQICHTGATPLGPDLRGAATRLSPEDLFNAIIFPNRDVAGPYRTTTFRLRNGETYTGTVAFESADGVILQTGATTTIRLFENDIVSRQPSNSSLMPSGLLDGLTLQELADLHAYLKSL